MWYLADKVRFWLYDRRQSARARHFAGRLDRLLRTDGYSRAAIFDQLHRALVAEAKGDLQRAIEFRKREVLVRIRALQLAYAPDAGKVGRRNLLEHFPPDDLLATCELLRRLQTRLKTPLPPSVQQAISSAELMARKVMTRRERSSSKLSASRKPAG
jgi:hypothetical protein